MDTKCITFLEMITYSHARSSLRDFFIRRRDYPNPLYLQGIENHPFKLEIASLIIRASYGGMDGDIYILSSFADIWYSRGGRKTEWILNYKKFFSEYKPLELEGDDILSEAADFHCFPEMIQDSKMYLWKNNKKFYSWEDIKNTIWYFRSGYYEKHYACHPEKQLEFMECKRLSAKEMEEKKRLLKNWADIWSKKKIEFIFQKKKIKVGSNMMTYKPITELLKKKETDNEIICLFSNYSFCNLSLFSCSSTC